MNTRASFKNCQTYNKNAKLLFFKLKKTVLDITVNGRPTLLHITYKNQKKRKRHSVTKAAHYASR